MEIKTIADLRKALGDNLTTEMGAFLDNQEQVLNLAGNKEMELESFKEEIDSLKAELSVKRTELGEARGKHEKASKLIDELKTELDEKRETVTNQGARLEELKVLEEERDNGIRSDYQKTLDEIKELEAFDKVKDDIVLPTDEKKLENYAIEEIQASKKTIEKYKNLGVFGAVDSRTGDSPTPKPKGEVDNFLSSMRKGAGLKPK